MKTSKPIELKIDPKLLAQMEQEQTDMKESFDKAMDGVPDDKDAVFEAGLKWILGGMK